MLIPIAREAFWPLLLVSFVVGLLLGAIYDVFRMRRVAFRLPAVKSDKPQKGFRAFVRRNLMRADAILCFFEDFLFCLFGTVVLILVGFKLYYGVPRWYSYGAATGGFCLYRLTIGRLVMRSAEAVIRFLYAVWCVGKNRVVAPLIARGIRLVKKLCGKVRFSRLLAYTRAEEARMLAVMAGMAEDLAQKKAVRRQKGHRKYE